MLKKHWETRFSVLWFFKTDVHDDRVRDWNWRHRWPWRDWNWRPKSSMSAIFGFTLWLAIWVAVSLPIIIQFSGRKLFFSRLFSVCSRTSNSNNWCLGICFVFALINFTAENLLSWLLIGYYFRLKPFIFCFENINKRQKWSVFWPWPFYPDFVWFTPQFIQYGSRQFVACGWVTFSQWTQFPYLEC